MRYILCEILYLWLKLGNESSLTNPQDLQTLLYSSNKSRIPHTVKSEHSEKDPYRSLQIMTQRTQWRSVY